MPDAQHLLVFIAAGWLLNLTPGPDVLCITTHSLRHGARAGLAAAVGVTAGCFIHVFAAALGVGALLAASATAFAALKWAGAAYLLWVGIKLLVAKPVARAVVPDAAGAPAPLPSLRSAFLAGFWTNVLNPKVAIFFLAFVPQFIAPDAADKALAFVLLGALFNLNSLPVNAGWALAAAWLARRGPVQHGLHWLDRAAGALFIAFGLRLALAEPPSR